MDTNSVLTGIGTAAAVLAALVALASFLSARGAGSDAKRSADAAEASASAAGRSADAAQESVKIISDALELERVREARDRRCEVILESANRGDGVWSFRNTGPAVARALEITLRGYNGEIRRSRLPALVPGMPHKLQQSEMQVLDASIDREVWLVPPGPREWHVGIDWSDEAADRWRSWYACNRDGAVERRMFDAAPTESHQAP